MEPLLPSEESSVHPQWNGTGLHGALMLGLRVPPFARTTHAALVRARIRSLSLVLAILTLAWVPMDIAWLSAGSLRALPLRLGMSGILLTIGAFADRMSTRTAVNTFIWSQAIGFGLLQWLVAPARDSTLEIGYGLFPFVLAAEVAILPLPWSWSTRALFAPAIQLAITSAFVTHTRGPELWSDAWLFGLLAAIALWASQSHLSLLVELLGARRDAAHDALTGLPNRRSAMERLEAEHLRSMRSGEPLSAMMIDIDHFKHVNDRWGHTEGDRVLVELASVLREELRGIDLAARYGGEEFLVVLPATSHDQALDAAERIRKHVEHLRMETATGSAMSMTVSIGIATREKGAPPCPADRARRQGTLCRQILGPQPHRIGRKRQRLPAIGAVGHRRLDTGQSAPRHHRQSEATFDVAAAMIHELVWPLAPLPVPFPRRPGQAHAARTRCTSGTTR